MYQRGTEIWTVKPDGTGAKKIASGPSTDAAWAPDAQHIVFSSSAFDAQNGPDLFVTGINGEGVTRVGGVADFGDTDPSWQPTVDSTDLAVSLSDTPDPVRTFHVVTYTATVSNNGPADARLVTLATGIPFGTTLGSVTTSQGGCTAKLASIACRLGPLPAGGVATVTIPVTVPNPFDISLGASLFSSQGDTDPSNDTDVDLTRVQPPSTSDPVARLNWIVPDRLRDYDGDGLIDEGKFNRPNLSPPPFEMTLMGCDSAPFGGITKYAFRVTLPNGDVLTQASSSCRFTFHPPREGVYPSKLTITTPEGTFSVEKDVPLRDFFIVSLGDSLASGEGNPDRHSTGLLENNDVWQDRRCHRSASSGPSQAALSLETSDRQSSVTFAHLACSGGQVTKGILEPYLGIEPDGNLIPRQANVMKQLMDAWHRKPDAVLISIGANDAEFADAVLRCLLPDRCQNDADFVAKVQTRLSRLPGRFDMLDEKLDALGIPGDKVWITEYPDPTRDDVGRFKQCLPTLYPSEWQWAEENVVARLNERVQTAANLDRHGWHFVGGIANAFLRHGYCAGVNWIVRLEQSLGGQGDQNGAFHPNELGHQEYMRRILDGLWRTLLLR